MISEGKSLHSSKVPQCVLLGTQRESVLFQSNCDISCTLIKESVLSFPLPSGDSGFEPSQINYAMHLESRKKVLIKLNIVSQSS